MHGAKSSIITVNTDGQFGLIKMHQSWSMLINVNPIIFLFKFNQMINPKSYPRLIKVDPHSAK